MPKMIFKMPQSEINRFQKWTDELSDENREKCKILIAQTAYNISRRAKMFAPVATSLLKNSIRVAFTPDKLGATVYTGRIYAPYVEFGTGNKVVAPSDVADYAMTFKGRGVRKVNLHARPYLFPAVRISLKEMYQKLNTMGFYERPQ